MTVPPPDSRPLSTIDLDDDAPVGRIISRRDLLRLLGVAGVGAAAGCSPLASSTAVPTAAHSGSTAGAGAAATGAVTEAAVSGLAETTSGSAPSPMPACVARPEATEGPYFVDERLDRSDIRSDPVTGAIKEGLPLALAFRVSRIVDGACTPLAGAMVDVWHCDAEGVYSDVSDPRNDTTGQKFLRGFQTTDASGAAAFTTIFPGWYQGRAVHIHFKIRTEENLEFTSQLFFDESTIADAYAREPYAARGMADTPNNRDGIYDEQLLVQSGKQGGGYSAVFDVGLLGA